MKKDTKDLKVTGRILEGEVETIFVKGVNYEIKEGRSSE